VYILKHEHRMLNAKNCADAKLTTLPAGKEPDLYVCGACGSWKPLNVAEW
jgi:hypothetical protein